MPKSASVAVIVASRGRPTELTELLSALHMQTVRAASDRPVADAGRGPSGASPRRLLNHTSR